MNEKLSILYSEAVGLLKELITIPSYSKEEHATAGALARFLALKRIEHSQVGNNIFAVNKHYDASKQTLLLNSHHDTVKPNRSYTVDPFDPIEKEGKLFGLGSNDAGGPLVALLACFLHFHDQEGLNHNIAFAATAEEEISGSNGIEHALKFMPPVHAAIVGEPTLMQMAVAERGLLVLDAVSYGKVGHAARNEGKNAITLAIKDIGWFNGYQFPLVSPLLGPVKMSVTSIETENKAHNVVPGECRFIVDIRINEHYCFEDVLDVISKHVQCDFTPRSLRLRSTMIAEDHPLVKAGLSLGRTTYGSPTTSDKALMPFPALKMGPGDSARSHSADEFIFTEEIREGIDLYIKLVEKVVR